MDFDGRDVDGRSRNYTSSNDPTVLVGKLVAQAFANSPLNATLREIPKRIAEDIESSLSHVGKRFQQGILQMTSDLNHQFASLGKRLAELGPPTTEMVLAAYDASKALSEGNAEPMDRFLVDYLKLSATPENRELLRNIVDSSLERDIRDVRDQWLVLGPKEAKLLVGQVNRGVRLYGEHKAALLAYGTSSDPRQRRDEELPTAVYYAWGDIQRPGHSFTLVDAVGNYLRVPLAGEKRVVQFGDTGRLADAVGELGREGKKAAKDGGKLLLRNAGAPQFEIQEFELREAVRLDPDVTALKTLIEEGVLQASEARTYLDVWVEKAGLPGREAQMYELDMRTGFNTAFAAHEMDVPEKKARDYRSRYMAKLRRAAEL